MVIWINFLSIFLFIGFKCVNMGRVKCIYYNKNYVSVNSNS